MKHRNTTTIAPWPTRMRWLLAGAMSLGWIPGICAADAPASPTPMTDPEQRVLTTAAGVRALSAEEAAQRVPVRLVGTVLSKQVPGGRGMFVENYGQAVWIQAPVPGVDDISVGDLVLIEGVSDPGGFSSTVLAHSAEVVGKGRMPRPIHLRIDEFPTLQMEARWVQVHGTVKSCREMTPDDVTDGTSDYGGTTFTPEDLKQFTRMVISDGNSNLEIKVGEALDPALYDDAEVIVNGVCVSQHNTTRQFVRQFLTVPTESCITVTQAPPENPFDVPLVPIGQLFQYYSKHAKNHRVRVRGVVTHSSDGSSVWIRGRNRGLLVTGDFRSTPQVLPGQVVDVIGFPKIENLTHVLEHSKLRVINDEAAPEPQFLPSRLNAAAFGSDLVAVEGTLTSLRETIGGGALSMEWDGAPLEALFDEHVGDLPEGIRPGAIIRVSGILTYGPQATPSISGMWNPRDFQLLVRTPADLQVVKPAPWWTPERLAWLLGLITAASLLTVGGVSYVSKRQIREQSTQRSMAEAEFSAVLNERNRLAREIHDTLAQGLNAVSMQLEIARNAHKTNPDRAQSHVVTAHRIVRSALTEARNSIWNMRSQVLEKTDLAGAIEGVLQQLVEGLNISANFVVHGRPRRMPPVMENNLLRIAQEAVANAVKHAAPSTIDVAVHFLPNRLRLEIHDDGKGFDLNKTPPKGSGFGLVGMRERASQIHGTIQVRSEPGQGSHIVVEVETPT